MKKLKASDLSLEEKLRIVVGNGAQWGITDDLDGKIYRIRTTDGSVGVRFVAKENPDGSETIPPSIAYPSEQVLSHSWSTKNAYTYGEAVANDCIDFGADIVLGPGVNIKRNPICGRHFEYFSEDPFLTGTLAAAYIYGVQDHHIGTSVKHYCCNNIEYGRHFTSSNIDEKTLREIYIKQFDIALKAKPWTVMCSYNKVNGTWMSENREVFDILRNEIGYKGLIVSDWNSSHNSVRSINGGIDLVMPYKKLYCDTLKEGAGDGSLDMKELDRACDRVLELAYKCASEKELRKITMSKKARRKVAYNIAKDGIVLLKNNNHALPLTNEKIVITGAPIQRYYAGGGATYVTPDTTPAHLDDQLRKAGLDVEYKETVRWTYYGMAYMGGEDITCRDVLPEKDAVVIAVGNPKETEHECQDRQTLRLSREEEDTIISLGGLGKKVIVVVYAGSAVDMTPWIDCADAVVYAGYPGQYGNEAVTDILTGKVNPSGRLTETFPVCLEDVPAEQCYRDIENFDYEEGQMVGYRYYTTAGYPVLYPFGYGLSYSDFVYYGLKTETTDKSVKLTFTVENTSNNDGIEIPQVYAGPMSCENGRPVRELVGFDRVAVKAHSKKKVSVEIPKEQFKYYSLDAHKWMKTKGSITMYVGKNANDIILKSEITL